MLGMQSTSWILGDLDPLSPCEAEPGTHDFDTSNPSLSKNEGRLKKRTAERNGRMHIGSEQGDSLSKRLLNWLEGWRGGLSLAVAADQLVILLALVTTFILAFRFDRNGVEVVLVNGNCSKIKNHSTWLHLFINICSTALLSTSSYAMQCLASPTRAEVRRAHAKHKYVDIGIASLRNLRYVSRGRAFMWLAVAVTSIPIHLLANSAVYPTTDTNAYLLFVVTQDFRNTSFPVDRLESDLRQGFSLQPTDSIASNLSLTVTQNQSVVTTPFTNMIASMERLDNLECMKAYSAPFLAGRRHVVAVSKLSSDAASSRDRLNKTYLRDMYYRDWQMPPWTCSVARNTTTLNTRQCDIQANLNQTAAQWLRAGERPHEIDYCLSEKVEESCKLRGNMLVLIVVLVCAIIKTVTIYLALSRLPDDILATLGDGIAFFLEEPEQTTAGNSLLDRDGVREYSYNIGKSGWCPGLPTQRHWYPRRSLLAFDSMPGMTFLLMFILQIIFLAGTGYLLGNAANLLAGEGLTKITQMSHLGFGSADPRFIITSSGLDGISSLLGQVVTTNTPQVLLSLYYFVYNQCWTNILITREWTSFGRQHESLRVSQPEGQQKSRYFLTVPYRFAIPLQISSALLHWLVAQTFFFLRLEVKAAEPFQISSLSILNAVGYSPYAGIFLVAIIGLHTICFWVFPFAMNLKSAMPLVGGCSLAISAACHVPPWEKESWLKTLRWGVVPGMEHGGILHCGLTTRDTYSPELLEREHCQVESARTKALFA